MFSLPNLKYKYNELEPYIDAHTMELHHSKHHQAYVTSLNTTLRDNKISFDSLRNLLYGINSKTEYSDPLKQQIKNFGGGHFNHSFFWLCMTPSSSDIPRHLEERIAKDFGSVDIFRTEFNTRAIKVFGSGWVWLYYSLDLDKLVIGTSINQDSPMMDDNVIPLLCLDVWEHAYYLKYQNNRKGYVEMWWNVVNWRFVNKLYEECVVDKKGIVGISEDGSLVID